MNENKTVKTGLQILVEEYQAKQYPTHHEMYERMLELLVEERALEASQAEKDKGLVAEIRKAMENPWPIAGHDCEGVMNHELNEILSRHEKGAN